MTPTLSASPVGKVPSWTEVMTPCVQPDVTARHFTWLEMKHAQCLWSGGNVSDWQEIIRESYLALLPSDWPLRQQHRGAIDATLKCERAAMCFSGFLMDQNSSCSQYSYLLLYRWLLSVLVCYWVLDEVLRKMLKQIGSDVTHVGFMVLLNKTHER